MPEISVIVPVYNVEKYIHRCIDSILAQTFTDFELILVDDGSPDKCPEICDGYAAKDSRVKVIHKENGGVSTARNAGLDIAQGEFIAFCDSDDYVNNTFLEKLNLKNCDLSICGFCMVDKNGSVINDEKNMINEVQTVTRQNIGTWYDHGYLYSVWRCLFKKSIIQRFLIRFDCMTSRGEDTIFILSYIEHCNKVNFCEETLYNYVRYGEGSLTTSSAPSNILSLAYLDNFLCRWFESNNVVSKNFSQDHYWTRYEIRKQLYTTLLDSKLSLYNKYSLTKTFCQIFDYSFFIDRFTQQEHPKYRMLMRTKSPLLILFYHLFLQHKNRGNVQ